MDVHRVADFNVDRQSDDYTRSETLLNQIAGHLKKCALKNQVKLEGARLRAYLEAKVPAIECGFYLVGRPRDASLRIIYYVVGRV